MMRNRQSFFGKFKIAALMAALGIVLGSSSGCADHFVTAPPTLSVPTPTAALPSVDSHPAIPTKTPDAEQEIHFTDINLEYAVREKLGKSIGAIRRADVESITELSARVRGIFRIDSLEYFTNLQELDLYGNRIMDFSVLAKLPTLRKLNIAKNYNILHTGATGSVGLDITPLKGLALLETLDLSDNMISDITPLGTLPALTSLNLSKNHITDISPLSACNSLEYLDISHNYGMNSDNTERGIADLSPLYGNLKLKTILAGENLITDLSGMEALPELSYLDVSVNYISSVDALVGAISLEKLNFKGNFVQNIDALRGHAALKELDASYNMIVNFDVIADLPALQKLKWEGNQIENYDAIDAFEARLRGEARDPVEGKETE